MKLTQIAIDGIGAGRAIQLDRLSQDINIIFCANGAGKARLKNFIRHTLFGSENLSDDYFAGGYSPASSPLNSFLDIQHSTLQNGAIQYRVSRNDRAGIADHVTIKPLTNHQYPNHPFGQQATGVTSVTPSQLVQGVDATAYDTFFNVSISETHSLIQRLIQQIELRFGTQFGRSSWNYHLPYTTWKSEAEIRNSQLSSLKSRQEQLGLEKNRLLLEIEQCEKDHSTRSHAISQQIDALRRTVNDKRHQIGNLRNQLAQIDRQISELYSRIEHLKNSVQQMPVETRTHDALPLLYQRLDEIDNQIRRWRVVQTDVHQERVRLRDEMATCDRLSIESSDHPYHVSRELVVGLESKVDATESIARRFEKLARTSNADPTENWNRVVELCTSMREDLYALCQELGRQYKHIRHKAAVAEMKQLRRCYHEMDENIKRLARRRESVLQEIRQLDPAGAQAIELAETQFCDCAEHEGYLEARRRFVGSVQTEVRFTPVAADWSLEQSQVSDLEIQRKALLQSASEFEADLARSESELNRLVAQQNSLVVSNLDGLKNQLRTTGDQWATVDQQIKDLMILIEEDRRLAQYVPDTFMSHAAAYLTMLTNGRLIQPSINQNRQLFVTNQHGDEKLFNELGRDHQDLVCLSLIASAVRAYAEKGVRLPLVIDNLFVNLDSVERRNAMKLLADISRNGQQVLALTGDREMLTLVNYADSLQQLDVRNFDLAVDDLPDTYIARPMVEPFVAPRSQPDYPLGSHSYAAMNVRNHSEIPFQQLLPVRSVVNTTMQNYQVPNPSGHYAPSYESGFNTNLSDIDLVESIYDVPLSACGVTTVRQLLELDPDDLSPQLASRGFLGSQIDRWQAQAWLLVCMPELKPQDARILVACGISEPEQINALSGNQILEKIKQYLGSSDGRRAGVNLARYDLDRMELWKRSLLTSKSQWSQGDGFSRRHQRRSWTRDSQNQRNASDPRFFSSNNGRTSQADFEPRKIFEPRNYEPRKHYEPRSAVESLDARERNGKLNTDRPVRPNELSSDNENHKFYLEMHDDLEAAPSIGAKTAERFHKIGIMTIADFLKNDSKSMADKLNYKRINASVIKSWQQQTQLMVQVPNMRVHDVQLLVACGFTDASKIAAMDPQKLFGVIKPFTETKDGERIVRSGKKPDLEEIMDWIESAGHQRSLQAA